MKRKNLRAIGALVLISVSGLAFAAPSLHSGHFFFVDAAPWVEIPPSGLKELARRVQGITGQAEDYLTGYSLGQDLSQFSPPFVVVKSNESGKVPIEQARALTAQVFEAGLARKQPKIPIKFISVNFDQASRVVWVELESKSAAIGDVRCIQAMVLTEKGFLIFALYTTPKDHDNHLTKFKELMAHVTISSELAYRVPQSATEKMANSAINGFLVASVFSFLGLIVLLGRILFARITNGFKKAGAGTDASR